MPIFAVHRSCSGKVLSGLFAPARAVIEPAKVEVTVGHDRTLTEVMGKVKRIRPQRELGEQKAAPVPRTPDRTVSSLS
jgi:hypothetical protein